MIDYLLAALSAGICAFVAFFIISFATLSLLAGVAHLFGWVSRHPSLAGRSAVGPKQAV